MKKFAVAAVMAVFCTVAVQDAMASDFGFKGVGGRIGLVNVEELDSTFGFEGIVDLGTVAPNWGMEANVGFWSWSEEQFGAKTSIRDIILGARTKYMFTTQNPQLTPFVGGGMGLHFLRAEVDIPAQGGFPAQSASASDTELGIEFGGGLAMHVSPQIDLVGEAWYGIINDVNQFSLKVGATRWFGN